jgi:LPPG:FO 2-phospho-L-lactate transferase
MSALARFVDVRPQDSSAAPTWFNLGDKDLATHFYRTARLREGATLAQVTSEISHSFGVDVHLVPMSNDRVSTFVTLANDCVAGPSGTEITFQEYFVKYQHSVAVSAVRFAGASTASVLGLDTLNSAQTVIIAPSNPLVSIAPLRALHGVDAALTKRRESVVAISPIIAGAALKGPADRLMTELGHESSVVGVAKLYAPICGTLIIDTADAHLASKVESEGMHCVVVDTVMSTPEKSKHLARTTLESAT